MQRMRDVIRGTLARSLRRLAEEDRLAAALPVVCGSAAASHCEVAHLDEGGTLHLRVDGEEWLASLLTIREILQHDLQRVAGVPLAGLHFLEAGFAPDRPLRPPPPSDSAQSAPGRQRSARSNTSTNRTRRPA